MLRGIHNASKNWLGRVVMGVIMGLLVISFAVWGIGDIFRGVGRTSVARVGDTEISIDLFRQTFNDRLQQLSRQVGRPVSQDQARAIGLDRQLLGQMVAETALDERTRQMGLAMANEDVARRITEDPSFRGPAGQFDRVRFEQLIRQAGYSEPRFVAEQRRVLLRQQIVSTVVGSVAAPKTAIQAQHHYQNEQRTIDYVVLDRAHAGEAPAPTPEVLARYFDERKIAFRAPEYRKIVVLSLTPDELARWIEIGADDVKRAYESQKARFSTPERRQVEQIVFPNADDAAKAAERLGGGASFQALAKERGLSEKDIDLGLLAKSDFVDPAIGDAAFALAEGATSAPVNGRFGTVLLRAAKIEPGATKSIAEVGEQIKRDLALAQAKDQLNKLRDKVDDELASGMTVDEVAKKLNLTSRTIEAVDRSGRNPDGQPVADLPAGADLVGGAFASDVGIENDALSLQGGGYLWYSVAAKTPARDRTLDEIKDRVEARWREDEIAARLEAKTKDLVDKLKAGSSLAEIAVAEKLTVQAAAGLKRTAAAQAVSDSTVAEVFRTPKGGIGSAEGQNATERVIFRVTETTVPPFDPASAEAKQITDTVRSAMAEDLLAEYVGRLQADLGVSVSQAGLNQALGLTSGSN